MVRLAVAGQMPKNNIRFKRMKKLHIFPDENFPFSENISCKLEIPRKGSINPLLAKKKLAHVKWEDIPDDGKLIK